MEEENREVYRDNLEEIEEQEEVRGDEVEGASSFKGVSGFERASDFEDDEGFENDESLESEADFEKRVRRRKAKIARRKLRRKALLLILMVALFSGLATMCGKDIIKLKRENRELKKKQQELQEERDILKKEVERSGQREYVQDQARKQLRLLNPGELLFTFEEDEEKEE